MTPASIEEENMFTGGTLSLQNSPCTGDIRGGNDISLVQCGGVTSGEGISSFERGRLWVLMSSRFVSSVGRLFLLLFEVCCKIGGASHIGPTTWALWLPKTCVPPTIAWG